MTTTKPCDDLPGALLVLGSTEFDLGFGHLAAFVVWRPDMAAHPQYWPLQHLIKNTPYVGAMLYHPNASDGAECRTLALFRCELTMTWPFPMRGLFPVLRWQPLTIGRIAQGKVSVHVLACDCGDRGYIAGGRWHPVRERDITRSEVPS